MGNWETRCGETEESNSSLGIISLTGKDGAEGKRNEKLT